MAFMAIAIIASSALIYQITREGFRTNSSISIFSFSQETIPLLIENLSKDVAVKLTIDK
jgi:hypothetical protein